MDVCPTSFPQLLYTSYILIRQTGNLSRNISLFIPFGPCQGRKGDGRIFGRIAARRYSIRPSGN